MKKQFCFDHTSTANGEKVARIIQLVGLRKLVRQQVLNEMVLLFSQEFPGSFMVTGARSGET